MDYTCQRISTQKDFKFKMLLKGTKTALQYWQIDGISYPVLSKEAIKVFSIVTSSASSEREFSSMAFIHSKLRNRLGNDKSEQADLHQE